MSQSHDHAAKPTPEQPPFDPRQGGINPATGWGDTAADPYTNPLAGVPAAERVIPQAAPALPWDEEQVYAAVDAYAVECVLDPTRAGPVTLRLDLTGEQAELARTTRHYRQGREILDETSLVFSDPWTVATTERYTAFAARVDRISPVVVVNCTPSAAVPVYRYAALVERAVE